MALPTSGPLTLTAIRNELEPSSGAAGLSLGYYRGKTYAIAAGGLRTIGSVPKFSDFYGLAGITYRLDDASYVQTNPGTASISFGSDGIFYATPNNSSTRTPRYNWVTGAAPSLYSVRCTYQSGDPLSTGSVGVWEQLNANRTFTRQSGLVDRTNTSLYEIRENASLIVVESAVITLVAPGTA